MHGARDRLVEAHAAWAEAHEFESHPQLTPFESPLAHIAQLSWELAFFFVNRMIPFYQAAATSRLESIFVFSTLLV